MNNNNATLGVAILNVASIDASSLSGNGQSFLFDGGDGGIKETIYLTDEDGNRLTDEDNNYLTI